MPPTTMRPRLGIREPRRKLSPALRTDLPLLVALLLCWLTVSAPLAHLLTGVALLAAVAVHLCTRHLRIRRLFRPGAWRPPSRLVLRGACSAVLVVAALASGTTGLLRGLGVPPDHVWHGGMGYLLLGLAGLHLVTVRHRLRVRLRPHSVATAKSGDKS